MSINKIIGIVLLVAGLVVISFSLYQSYNIFTDKTPAPLIFKTSNITNNNNAAGSDVQKQIENTVQQQINQILPSASITKILNLLCWSMFAMILIFGGSQISGLGIKMLNK